MRLHGQMAAQVTMLQLVHLEPAEQLASDVDQLHRGGRGLKMHGILAAPDAPIGFAHAGIASQLRLWPCLAIATYPGVDERVFQVLHIWQGCSCLIFLVCLQS